MHIKVKANAKLNLTLDITGQSDDGLHTLKSIMQSLSLSDIVTISTNNSGIITVTTNNDLVPDKKGNIAYKASEIFLSSAKLDGIGVEIDIDKNIPVAAGLAGGSADAAAVLFGLNTLFDECLSNEKLIESALRIGSDVPFCLRGGTMLVEGIGELLSPLSDLPDCYFLLVKPCDKVSTGEMYKKYDNINIRNRPDNNAAVEAICSGNVIELSRSIYNVFEEVWENSDIASLKEFMIQKGALTASITGSGPTVFGLFSDESAVNRCYSALKNKYNQMFLCKPAKVGCDKLK